MRQQEKGEQIEEIISDLNTEYCIDDMVFDSRRGFYFTDFRGYSTQPLGGVYYVDPETLRRLRHYSKYFCGEWYCFKYG